MSGLCNARGPRGVTCALPAGHQGPRHTSGEVDEPAEPCDVCVAKAGEHCADPGACRDARSAAKVDRLVAALFDWRRRLS